MSSSSSYFLPLGLHDHFKLKHNCIFCCKVNSSLNSFLSEFINFKIKFNTKNRCSNSKLVLNPANNCLKLYYQNVRGLRTKLHSLHTNFVLLSYDIFILTETWLTSDITDAELGLTGYTIFRCDRCKDTSDKLRGGGTLIAIKNKFQPTSIIPPSVNVEQLFVSISLGKTSILICSVYLPPGSETVKYESHTMSMDQIWQSYNFDLGMVCGDFNLPNVIWTNSISGLEYCGQITDKVRLIGDQYNLLHWEQKNIVPNANGSLLDLVFSSNSAAQISLSPDTLIPLDLYHPPLSITFPCLSAMPIRDPLHMYRDFKKADYENILKDLVSTKWDDLNLNANELANLLQKLLLDTISKWVPLRTYHKSTFPSWVSASLKNLLIKKKRAHKLYKNLGGANLYNNFSSLRARCKLESKRLYRLHIHNIQLKLSHNPKIFWQHVRNLQGGPSIPKEVHLGDLKASGDQAANLFATYFSSVYSQPRTIPNSLSNLYAANEFSFLPSKISVTITEVHTALESLQSTRGSGPDGIAASFLYHCKDILALPICLIFNKSLIEGSFPSIWKISRVTPILKSGNPADVQNYRPISGLPFLGKLFESIVLKRIDKQFNSIISVDQHGFFPGRSTITSAVDFTSYVYESFERKQQIDVIYTDFSKAFDSIDHGTLIYTLDRLGVGEPFLSWLTSYLHDRYQFIHLFNTSSKNYRVLSGVPQGSHLGPLLFNIFINNVFSIITPGRALLFADDAKIFYSISSIGDCVILQNVLDKFANWCNIFGLSLNTNKCKIMSFHRSRRFLEFDYCLNGQPLERVNQVKDLGFTYVPSLDFRPHIDSVAGKALRVLGFIRRHFSNFDNPKCLSVLYNSHIRSLLEYGAVVWSPYTMSNMQRLDRVQNRFLSFAGHSLNVTHPPHDYSRIKYLFKLKSLSERHITYSCHFIQSLIDGKIDAPRLLERLSIRIPGNTRNKDFFYVPLGRSNFAKNAPITRMMSIFNNKQ